MKPPLRSPRKLRPGRLAGLLACAVLWVPGAGVSVRAEGEPLALPVNPKAGGLTLRVEEPSLLPGPAPMKPDFGSGALTDLLPSFPTVPPPTVLPEEPDLFELNLRRRVNPTLVPDGPNPTEDAAVSLNLRHRYQVARARAMEDPAVRESLAASKNVHTDRELRSALRRHYSLLFARMRALDSSLEPLVKERETASMSPLEERIPRANPTAAREASAPVRAQQRP